MKVLRPLRKDELHGFTGSTRFVGSASYDGSEVIKEVIKKDLGRKCGGGDAMLFGNFWQKRPLTTCNDVAADTHGNTSESSKLLIVTAGSFRKITETHISVRQTKVVFIKWRIIGRTTEECYLNEFCKLLSGYLQVIAC